MLPTDVSETLDRQSLTNVIQRSGAEFSVERLGPEPTEVRNGEGPQVKNVVSGERFPLLHYHHLSPQEGQLDGCSQPTWPCAQHQTLGEGRGGEGKWRPVQIRQESNTNAALELYKGQAEKAKLGVCCRFFRCVCKEAQSSPFWFYCITRLFLQAPLY